jgi:16S rRNA (adenine1518-N6/adenine1519-N6)-dimethyltransferase
LTKPIDAKKSLGQHFLTDRNICRKITCFAGIKSDDTVIEIGPGTGNLTAVLLEHAQKVIGIEYDPEMIRYLSSRFPKETRTSGKLKLIHSDVLKFDWNKTVGFAQPQSPTGNSSQNRFLSPIKVIGNLPYNISTQILSNMTESKCRFQTAVFMVQREVAHRISALPGKKDYGYFSLLMQFHFAVQRGFDVRPGGFVPRPKVVSHVIKLTPREAPSGVDYEQFLRIISSAFRQRRKTLWNNLSGVIQDEQSLKRSFESCGVHKRSRPEQVNLQQYLCMTRVLSFPS